MAFTVVLFSQRVFAETPSVSYIFPAGGQRGTAVEFKIGGHYLHEACPFEIDGTGIQFSKKITRTKTVWFDGPVIPMPASQRSENYPQDYAGTLNLSKEAELGNRYWRVWNSQGITPSMKFIVGDYSEIVEQEIDGTPLPTSVKLPVTINGRIFPREDIDVWTFTAKAGQVISCEVHAARLGSELDSHLEIRDPNGRRIAENIDWYGSDSFVRFTAPTDGIYSARIQDINFGGLQHFVYRLTITAGAYLDSVFPLGGQRGQTVSLQLTGVNLPSKTQDVLFSKETTVSKQTFLPGQSIFQSTPISLEIGDLSEYIEREQSGHAASTENVVLPCTVNGRIQEAEDVDVWSFEAKKGDSWKFEMHAVQLGSELDPQIEIVDQQGKEISKSRDTGSAVSDFLHIISFPADGTYSVKVHDRFASRGGNQFAYRLIISKPASPNFRITVPSDSINVPRGGEFKLKVLAERLGDLKEEIELEFQNLPAGVTVESAMIPKNKSNVQIVLKAAENAKIEISRITLVGKAKLEKTEIKQTAQIAGSWGEPIRREIHLAVTVPTPFKFHGIFESKYSPRGANFVRHYFVDRNGFNGPLEISLADRQTRHLQGVTGKKIVLPPGESEFDYEISLPPYMQIGRTSRTCLMAVGIVEESDGTKHKVSFSSSEQADQIIILVDPARLSVETAKRSLKAVPGKTTELNLKLARADNLQGPIQIELILPKHLQGVTAEKLVIPAKETTGQLKLHFASSQLGPFNAPVTIRATTNDPRGKPVIAEWQLQIVAGN